MVANIDAVMVSKINVETFKNILSLKKKFTDFNFEISTWEDGFILELLKWFDNKIKQISNLNEIAFEYWKDYYEQIVRVLYYFVVYKDIKDSKQLSKIFSYLFSIDNSYKNNYNTISSEKLMNVYNYLINHTPNLKEQSQDREYIDVLIGSWKTKEMENKIKYIRTNKNNIIHTSKSIIIENCNDSDLKLKVNNDDNVVYSKSISFDDINGSDVQTKFMNVTLKLLKVLSSNENIIINKINVEL